MKKYLSIVIALTALSSNYMKAMENRPIQVHEKGPLPERLRTLEILSYYKDNYPNNFVLSGTSADLKTVSGRPVGLKTELALMFDTLKMYDLDDIERAGNYVRKSIPSKQEAQHCSRPQYWSGDKAVQITVQRKKEEGDELIAFITSFNPITRQIDRIIEINYDQLIAISRNYTNFIEGKGTSFYLHKQTPASFNSQIINAPPARGQRK